MNSIKATRVMSPRLCQPLVILREALPHVDRRNLLLIKRAERDRLHGARPQFPTTQAAPSPSQTGHLWGPTSRSWSRTTRVRKWTIQAKENRHRGVRGTGKGRAPPLLPSPHRTPVFLLTLPQNINPATWVLVHYVKNSLQT